MNIQKQLESYAFETQSILNINSINDLKFYSDIINIILKNNITLINENKEDYLKTSKILKYAYCFLKDVNSNLGQEFISAFNKGDIKVDISTLPSLMPNMIFDLRNEEKYVNLPLKQSIQDTSALIHEYIHYTTTNINNVNDPAYSIFRETPSVASEYIFEDYALKKNINYNGIYTIGNFNIEAAHSCAVIAKIKMLLLNEIITNKKLDLKAFANKYSKIDLKYITEVLTIILNEKDMFIMNEFQYIIATILAADSLNTIERLYEAIKVMRENPINMFDVANLELSRKGDTLKKNVLERLENNYVKSLVKRNNEIWAKR